MNSAILAAITNPIVTTGQGQDGASFFAAFIPRLVTIVLIIGALAFIFMFLLGGIKWVTSGGDKGTVESARSQIIHAVTGLVVLFSLWAILNLLNTLFGINLLNIDFSPVLQS